MMPFLDLDGARLHYETAGSGPAIVLIHGGMCSHADWARLSADLSRDHTVVAPNLRGHGQSDGSDFTIARYAADLAALVEHLALAPALLVGHSMASRVAAEAAWRHPGLVAGIVLLDGSRSQGGLAATEPDAPLPTSLAAVIDTTIGPYAGDADRAEVSAVMSAASPALMAALVETMRDWDLSLADRVFTELEAPLLAIQSTYHDQFTPRRSLTREDQSTPYLAFLQSARPDIETVILPETGHFSMRERPDSVAALIRAFSQKTWERSTWQKSA